MGIFISCSFGTYSKPIADWVQSTFKYAGVDAYISGQVEAKSLPESVKQHIRSSEAMIVIVTQGHSEWVQNEIGISYDAGIPVYAIVQDDVEVRGILPHITIYEKFSVSDPSSLIEPVKRIIEKIYQKRREVATAALIGLAAFGIFLLILAFLPRGS
jgi:hypothetical protein